MAADERLVSQQDIEVRCSQNLSVQGSLAMEGLVLDPASAEIGRRFERGEISLPEFSAAMQANLQKLCSAVRPTRVDAA